MGNLEKTEVTFFEGKKNKCCNLCGFSWFSHPNFPWNDHVMSNLTFPWLYLLNHYVSIKFLLGKLEKIVKEHVSFNILIGQFMWFSHPKCSWND